MVAMARGQLLCWVLAACVFHAPSAEPPRIVDMDPPNETQSMPPTSFNIMLSFQEAVQAGPGSLRIENVSDPGKSLSVMCSGGLLLTGSHAVVPVTEELEAGLHEMLIPTDCFRNQAGDDMEDVSVYSFNVVADAPRAPQLRQALTLPPNGSWVPPAQRFTFVFSEAVQGGDASVSIMQSMASTSSKFLSIKMDQPSQSVEFDQTIPGMITFDPVRLPENALYSFQSEAGALRDLAGLPVGGSGFLGGGSYIARVSAGLVRRQPSLGQSSGVSRHTSIVLEFDKPVLPGDLSSEVKLCTQWRATNPCSSSVPVPAEGVYFLGRILILRPAVDLQPGVHNVSLSPELARYFQGFVPDATGAWPYSFSVDPQGAMDSAAPELVTGVVDCGNSPASSCAVEGLPGGFMALPGSTGHSVALLSGSKFKLYFGEQVEVGSGRTAQLRGSDSSSAPTSVAISVGSGPGDVVATMSLNLAPATRYTLTLGSGVLTDTSVSKNAYAGRTFSFFSPLSLISSTLKTGDVAVPKTSTIGLTFDTTPRPGSKAYFTILSDTTSRGEPADPDSRSVDLSDFDQVLIQGQSIFLTPIPSLLLGRTYSISLNEQALELLEGDLVITFSTRADDLRKPVAIHTTPSGTLSKVNLDKLAPSVRFSERVAPAEGRRIFFRTPRGVQYTLNATDADCGLGGTEADACVVMDLLGSKVSFYPLGKRPGGSTLPAPWAKRGTTYHITVEEGAFSDASQSDAATNAVDKVEFSFIVSGDDSGPFVVDGSLPGDDDSSVGGEESSVFLTFNEVVEAGDNNVAIRVWDHISDRAPSLVAAGPEKVRLEPGAGWRQTVVLSFDTAIQAASSGDHKLHFYDFDSQQILFTVPVRDAAVSSNLLLFNMSSAAAAMPSAQERFFVRSSSAGAIVSSAGVAAQSPLDTRDAASFQAVTLAIAGSRPTMLWSSVEEFVCFSADGILSDIQVYMSQEISSVDSQKNLILYDCGEAACDTSQMAPLWTLSADGTMVSIDAAKPFKLLLHTSKLAAGLAGARGSPLQVFHHYRLDLESAALEGFGATPPLSMMLSISFSVCEVRYGTPASPLVRVYSPRTFATSASLAARQFEVEISQSALTDQWGNPPASSLTFEFMHEATLPVLEPTLSNPPNEGIANPRENVILAFNEVVQCGTGSLQLWSTEPDIVRFEIDIAKIATLSVDGHNLISGRYVSITPKTLCSVSAACTDLVAGTTYYLKTSAPGVLKDRIGNKLAELDTSQTWTFSVSTQDTKAPQIAFIAGHTLLPPQGIYPSQFVGYIYFSEQVVQNPSGIVTLQDCGPDLDCNNNADNSVSYLSAELSFGDGTASSGYGLMSYSRYLTRIDRRYRVRIMPNLVSDVVASGTANSGPKQMYIYDAEVGSVPKQYADVKGPKMGRKSPVNTQTYVEPDAGMVLNFNEDVQRGSGSVQFCLNGDARVAGNPDCVPGSFADGTPAVLDVASAVVDRRRVVLDWPKPLAYNQRLFVLMNEGSFKDVPAGNPSNVVEMTIYSFSVRPGDAKPPQLDYYTLPTASSGRIQLYFSESVQLGSGAHALKVTGSAESASNLVTLVSGNVVSLQASWTNGASYELDLPSDSFKDLAGNAMTVSLVSSAFSIPAASGGPFALGPLPDGQGSLAVNEALMVPTNGSTDVVPSSTVKLVFAQTVQAGSGSFSIGPLSLPVEQCVFVGPQAVCDPPGYLGRNELYTVTIPTSSVENSAGATFLTDDLVFSFRTLDLDLVPPVLDSVFDGSLENLNPNSLVSLHFNEVVQAGTGSFVVEDSDGTLAATINIQGTTPGTEVYFNGSVLHMAKPGLEYGEHYTLSTSGLGVILDTAKQPLGQITKEIVVVAEDVTPPIILAYIPRNDSLGEAAPSADIRLYFSEAVQAVHGGSRAIEVSDGLVTESVPVAARSNYSGFVTISGSVVTVVLYQSMGYNRLVTLSIPPDCFTDLAGNPYAGTSQQQSYRWRTALSVFEAVTTTEPPPGRVGAVLQAMPGGTLLMHGGRTDGITCHSDTYTSSSGSEWQQQSSSSTDADVPVPEVAYAASAADASGCVWLLGGQCSGSGTSTLWKSCSLGVTWDPLPAPTSMVQGVDWPQSFSGQAIAVLGGWQLVVVDLGRGDFWLFQDRGATSVVRTAEGLAFAPRRDSTLLVSSSNDLYLVGGSNCSDDACTNGQGLTDVWRSEESFFVGRNWERLTSNYAAGLAGSDEAEIGRQGAAAVMTYDDTIYFIGGQQLDSAATVATTFSSLPGPQDLQLIAAPRLTVPLSSAVVHSLDVVSLYFGESIQLRSAQSVRLLDLGLDKSVGGTGADADSIVPFAVSAAGQVLHLQRQNAPQLLAGHAYQVAIADGALTDAAGNAIAGFAPYKFSVSSDRIGPLVSVVVPTGTSVPPWTTFVLEADEALRIGSGSLELSCTAGASYRLPVLTARLVGKKAFFELPEKVRLTEGQQYTMNVPSGLFLDAAGNAASAASFTFTVLSGVVSSSVDGYAATNVIPASSTISSVNTQDQIPPNVLQISPPVGATDVPAQGAAILVRYSEPVKIGDTGALVIEDDSGMVVDGVNASDADMENRLILVTSGVKFMMNPLQAGMSYTFSIPEGVVTDLNGNPAPAVTGAFTCLSGSPDTDPPVLVMTEPATGAVDVPDTLTHITMWFSEKVEAGSGFITIVHPSSSTQDLAIDIKSSNVTSNGTRLQVAVPTGTFDEAGSYRVELPAGVLLDNSRAAQGGGVALEEVTFSFTAKPADTVPPSLVATEPPSEGSSAELSFQLPLSTTLLLTFSETVQAGAGAATFVPQTGSESLSFDVAGPEVVFAGDHMLIVPAADLAPGEVYSLRMSADTVLDSVGNSFEGLDAGAYVVSTAPRILFQRAGQFDGARYSVGATVDSSNNIYVVGGADGTKLNGRRLMNGTLQDVWQLRTKRQSNCGAYFGNALACPRSSCSGSPPTLGSWEEEIIVWHPPSVGGRRCFNKQGIPQSEVGDVVQLETGSCPCPECPDLPLPLPTNMVNSSYVEPYGHEFATGRSLPLLCKRGYAATGDFRCVADTVFAAEWKTPYPSCEPKSCKAPPPKVDFQDPSTAGAQSPCADISPTNPLAHGSSCPMLCKPGYQPKGVSKGSGAIRCELGVYQVPVCEPQQCLNRYTITNGTLKCLSEEVFLDGYCIVLCKAGYELVGQKRANCTATSSTPESTPELTQPGICQPRSCADLQLSDPRGMVLSYANGLQTTGSVANVGCSEGYVLSETSFNTFQCISNSDVPEEESGWVGNLRCVRRQCTNFPNVGNGYFTCAQPLFGDSCKLECELGYVLHSGTGIYTCQADGRLSGVGRCREVACPAPPMGRVPHAIKNDCPQQWLSGVECEVTSCRDGYEPRGNFMCKYGGFNKMPACVTTGVKADIKWYYLSALTLFADMRSPASLDLVNTYVSDQTWFWGECAEAVADGLNQVELTEVPIIDNVVLLNELSDEQFPASQGEYRIWITFRVRAQNVSEINYWLGQKQALVKARFASSLEVRVQDLKITSMLLAPAELAIAYSEEIAPKKIVEEDGFFERLTSLDNTDTAEVALGAMVGIVLGLMASLVCVCMYRRYYPSKKSDDNQVDSNKPFEREVS